MFVCIILFLALHFFLHARWDVIDQLCYRTYIRFTPEADNQRLLVGIAVSAVHEPENTVHPRVEYGIIQCCLGICIRHVGLLGLTMQANSLKTQLGKLVILGKCLY